MSGVCCRQLPLKLLEAMACHWGYSSVQGYIAFFRLALLYDWFSNGQSLQALLSILVSACCWVLSYMSPAHHE